MAHPWPQTLGPPPFDETAAGLRLRVRLTPRAGREALEGVTDLADGRRALKLRVAAPPVDGAANAAVIAFLAKGLGVAKSRVSIVAGETSRQKSVAVEGEAGELAARLSQWLAASGA